MATMSHIVRQRRAAGRVAVCAGDNGNSQLGDGSYTDRSTPTAVSGSHTFSVVATGGYHTCGVLTSGATLCWGECGVGAYALVVPHGCVCGLARHAK